MRSPAVLLLVWALAATGASAAPGGFDPHAAFVYPAGGRQGTSFRIVVGGQFLRGVRDVLVSGEGVHATVAFSVRALSPQQSQLVNQRLKEWFGGRRGGFPAGQGGFPGSTPAAGTSEKLAVSRDGVDWPDLPILADLEKKSPEEIRGIMRLVTEAFVKQRTNPQMAESLFLDVTIDQDAAPGDREIRLAAPGGLANPMRFQVGQLPEVREPDPVAPRHRMPGAGGKRGWRMASGFGQLPEPPQPTLEPPVVVNGQVLEGEVDRFPLRARKGQRLVVRVEARSLLPYLADAVPGWFQAVVALYDPKGKEIAFADDYRYDPDPVLYYEIPEDGQYQLEIRDSIHRGRDDFVYRVSVSEQPFITRLFPLGGRAGAATVATVAGWNLPQGGLTLDTRPGPEPIRRAVLRVGKSVSNPVPYAVDALPEVTEAEPNDSGQVAQRVALPVVVNGRISRAGDVDVFRIEGHAGDEVVAEVYARRLGSPLDSLLKVIDASGRVVAWNDDHPDPEFGLLTHQSDSYVCARLPQDGGYFIKLSDTESHGDDAAAYRLHLRPRTPDFAVRVTPSSLSIGGTGITLVTAHAARRDGFDGDIDLVLKGAPSGFQLSGARIPHRRDCVRMTLSAPFGRPARFDGPVALQIEARAQVGEKVVTHPAVPADDLMQAFAYRHLVPRQAMLVTVGGRRGPSAEIVGGPVRVPAGGSAKTKVRMAAGPMLRMIKLELSDAPKGVTIQDVSAQPDGLAFELKVDAAGVKAGYADNLIVEAFAEAAAGQGDAKGPKRSRRYSIGVLPAIPFEVVQQ